MNVISCAHSRSTYGLRFGGKPTEPCASAVDANAVDASTRPANTLNPFGAMVCFTRILSWSGPSQVYPGHLPGLLEAEHREQRRPNVAQRAARPERPVAIGIYHDEGDRIGRVRRMGPARLRVDHHLAVAVIRGD